MAKDYAKHYPNQGKKTKKKLAKVPGQKKHWRAWLFLLFVLVIAGGYLSNHFNKLHKKMHGFSEKLTTTTKVVKTVENNVTEPEFDFYTILPKEKVNIAASDLASNGKYVLVVGSYKTSAAAAAVKNKLALLGYSAFVEEVKTGFGYVYKVDTGPYKTEDDAAVDQKRLADEKFNSVIGTRK